MRMVRNLAFVSTLASFGVAAAQVSSPPLRIFDEGVLLSPVRYRLNFTGSGVSCADDATNRRVNCTISGGGGTPSSGSSPFTIGTNLILSESGLTAPRTFTFPDLTGVVLTAASAATVTNKTISGASNTLSNIPESSVTNLTTDLAAKLPLAGGTMTGPITFSGTQLGTYTLGGTPTLAASLTIADNAVALGDATHRLTMSGHKIAYVDHIVGSGSTPTITTGDGIGTGGTCSISGTDTAGLITAAVGTIPSGTGHLCKVSFATAYTTIAPVVAMTPADINCKGLRGFYAPGDGEANATTVNEFYVETFPDAVLGSTTYKSWYHVIGRTP